MKRETGFSFVEYLNRTRVKKATFLMSDPAAKAFEVAESGRLSKPALFQPGLQEGDGQLRRRTTEKGR